MCELFPTPIGMTTVISVRGRKRADLLADPNFVYVGRWVQWTEWTASPFGNPFTVKLVGSAALKMFEDCLRDALSPNRGPWVRRDFAEMARRLPELNGKVCGCWCGDWEPDQPEIGCHAVVLAKLANALPSLEEASHG